MKIKELDSIVLTEALPDAAFEPGDVGTVVMIHGDGAGYDIEFTTSTGETLAVVTVPADAVRPVTANEIAHARRVA
ncbi:MAG TPA: DUF4926 domain-containing protein [Steroidobacteraceae bacterium]|nr:DUF4926 domain-containing protein [Steroidobacteraceae bacterium]